MKTSTIFAVAIWLATIANAIVKSIWGPTLWISSTNYFAASVLVGTFLVFGWFLADAREHGIRPSPLLKIMVIAISIIAVPYYRFRYMGAKRGFIFLGKVLGGFVAAVLVATIVLLVYGPPAV